MIDIVFSDGNEKEFLKMGKKLGFKKLIFVNKDAFIAKNSNEVNKQRTKFDYVFANEDWAFNDKRVDLIFDLENIRKKDFLHHRASGLNQVRAKQLRDNKTKLGFDFNLVLGKDKDLVIGKMMQNVRLCRKYKVAMKIASFAKNPYEMRAPKDFISFGISLGMHPSEAKKALN